MTIDQILADLKDAHRPLVDKAAGGFDIAWQPFAIVALGALVAGTAILWRREGWRRQARCRFRMIQQEPQALDRWQELVRFAQEVGMRSGTGAPLPDCAYIPGTRAQPKDFAEVEGFVARALRFGFKR